MKSPWLRACAVASSVSLGALLVLRASGGCSSPAVTPEPSAASAAATGPGSSVMVPASSSASGNPTAEPSASSQPTQAPAFFQGSKSFGELPDSLPTTKGSSKPEFFGGSKAPPPMLPSKPPTNTPKPTPNQAP
jgi:hypothetical protein